MGLRRELSSAAAKTLSKPKLSWLNLQGCGVSAIERLCLEEALLRHDPHQRSWGIVGLHDPAQHSRLLISNNNINGQDCTGLPTNTVNRSCAIIMGIGGKPDQLLNLDMVRKNGVVVVKRFSGGGTVVVDDSSLWTTFIGRTKHLPEVMPYPRDIMEWSATDIFGPAFENMRNTVTCASRKSDRKRKSLVLDTKSCGLAGSGRTISFASSTRPDIPDFALRENDYVLGEHKMGGNAQSITKDGWLHHTSFLWDFMDANMDYLTLPNKRPEYRGDRSHGDFLVKLKKYYGELGDFEGKRAFFDHVKAASADKFDLEEVTLPEVLEIIDSQLGGMQIWFNGKCRTRIVKL